MSIKDRLLCFNILNVSVFICTGFNFFFFSITFVWVSTRSIISIVSSYILLMLIVHFLLSLLLLIYLLLCLVNLSLYLRYFFQFTCIILTFF